MGKKTEAKQREKSKKRERGKVDHILSDLADGPTPEALSQGLYEQRKTGDRRQVGHKWQRRSGVGELVASGTIEDSDRDILERIALARQLIVQGIGHATMKFERTSQGHERDWTSGQQAVVLQYLSWDKECRRLGVNPLVTATVAVFDCSLRECVTLGLVPSRYASRESLLDGLAIYRKVRGERPMARAA